MLGTTVLVWSDVKPSILEQGDQMQKENEFQVYAQLFKGPPIRKASLIQYFSSIVSCLTDVKMLFSII